MDIPGLEAILRTTFSVCAFDRPLPIPLPEAGDPAHLTDLFAVGRDNPDGRGRLEESKLDIAWNGADRSQCICLAAVTQRDFTAIGFQPAITIAAVGEGISSQMQRD